MGTIDPSKDYGNDLTGRDRPPPQDLRQRACVQGRCDEARSRRCPRHRGRCVRCPG